MIVSILNQFSKSSGLAARTAAVQGNGFGIKKLSGQKVGQPGPDRAWVRARQQKVIRDPAGPTCCTSEEGGGLGGVAKI